MIGPLLALSGVVLGGMALARAAAGRRQEAGETASQPASDTGPAPSPTFAVRVADAMARHDAAALRALAREARAAGRADIAVPLEREADRLERSGKASSAGTGAPTSGGSPSSPMPAEAAGRDAAVALTDYLRAGGGLALREHEDRGRVADWQGKLGLDPDGKYGRASAWAVAKRGLVPVVPFYWPKKGTAKAKRDFKALMGGYANADPSRANEWAALMRDIDRA